HLLIKRGHFRQVANAPLHFHRLFENIKSRHRCGSRSGRQETRQHVYGRGFARAVWAEKAHDLLLLDLERNVVDSRIACVLFCKLTYANHSFLVWEENVQIRNFCDLLDESPNSRLTVNILKSRKGRCQLGLATFDLSLCRSGLE